MKAHYLLPNKYKNLGWLLFVAGLVLGIYLISKDYDVDFLELTMPSIYSSDSFVDSENGFFKLIHNSIFDELVAITIIIGGLLVVFTKEKVEDEFIYKLRNDSLLWAFLFNYALLILALLFVYNMTFFDVLVFNMFTPLVVFIIRFNILKYKSASDEE